MFKYSLLSALAGLTVLSAAIPATAADKIHYTLIPNATEKRLEVSIVIPTHGAKTIKLQMPKWAPGSYNIMNAADSVRELTAKAGDSSTLEVKKDDQITWSVATNGAKEITVSYWLAPRQGFGGRGGAVDSPKHAHASGPSTYMYIVGRKLDPIELTVVTPTDWKCVNSLDTGKSSIKEKFDASLKTWHFSAPNYDVFADAPTEMGDFAEQDFMIRGVPHKVLVYGSYANIDQALLLDQCKKISKVETDFFNDVPYKRYIYMFRASGGNGRGAGGLEHLGSTEIGLSGGIDDIVRSVSAHEFFHLWNVKRIRPFVLGPFDYTGPVRTKNLWWSEGVTSYYGDLLSRRGGLSTDEQYLKHVAQTIATLQNNPARLKVTADEASYTVWDGGGSQGGGGLSYYTKGELIGLCMDLKIRHVTNNHKSLDDVIRALYLQCGKGNGPGFGEDDIRTTVSSIAATDLNAFYDQVARSTQELPFAECLGYVGLTVKQTDTPVVTGRMEFFTQADTDKKGMRVFFIRGGAANMPLQRDDLITEVDGKPAITALPPILARPTPGAVLSLTVVRGDMTLTIPYTITRVETRPWVVEPLPSVTPEELKLRNSWLSGK